MPSQSVLLAGATGMLGARIAHHLLETDDVDLSLLVRPEALRDPAKRSALDAFAERGAELVEGDVTDAASLDRATKLPGPATRRSSSPVRNVTSPSMT